MAHPTSSHPHVAHPLVRSAEIDFGIVILTLAAIALSFATGQGVADWRNIVFPPIVVALALTGLWLVVAEIREFARTAGDSGHRGRSVAGVVVALVAMVLLAPMVLIMPFVFLGAVT
jgi:hypothetical protein